jgi:hypothetical protein
MHISVASPQYPRQYRPRRLPQSWELIQALATKPIGWWLRVELAAIAGSSLAAKQNTTVRAARRYFKRPVQVMVEDVSLFIRRVPGKNEIHEAMPIDWSKVPRPAYLRKRELSVAS